MASTLERPQAEYRDRVREYYRQNQFFYDWFWTERHTLSMNYGLWQPNTRSRTEAFENQNALIAAALQLRDGDDVCEAGCGTGGTSIWLAERFSVCVHGITLSDHQAHIARRYARARGVASRVTFSVMDYTRTGLRTRAFDKMFGSESVCYAPEKSDFLREAHRLLRADGRLVVLDGFLRRPLVEPAEHQLFSEWSAGWAVPGLDTPVAFEEKLLDVGFERIEFHDVTDGIARSSRSIFMRGLVGFPVFWTAHRLGIATHAQLGHVRASIRQYQLFRRNLGVFGLFTAQKAER